MPTDLCTVDTNHLRCSDSAFVLTRNHSSTWCPHQTFMHKRQKPHPPLLPAA